MFDLPSPHRRSPRGGTVRLVLAAVLIASAVSAVGVVPAAARSGVAWPTQGSADRGTDVVAIQGLLRAWLLPDPTAPRRPTIRATTAIVPQVDGVFGTSTRDAVISFQLAHGLAPTGLVDGSTWSRLAVPLASGDHGPAVAALQRELVDKRAAVLAVDGIFGATTRSAVIAFQTHVGVAATGLVDTATWRALVRHYELPLFSAAGLCDFSVGNGPANWGTAEAIASLELVGAWSVGHGFGRVAVGDVSLEHGGPIAGHVTHRVGLDADIRPLRKANDQCTTRTRWTSTGYDRAATRALVKAIRALAPGHVKLVYFNDPILISEGLTRWHVGHDDHLHIRFCEASYPDPAYRC